MFGGNNLSGMGTLDNMTSERANAKKRIEAEDSAKAPV